ncbi:hypothetical protein D3O61_22085 [Vibrio vulnificus]|nr:hypothetical protein [Vibrio vulnificus]
MARNNPITAGGSRRQVEVSCVAWIDLLGYGAMLKRANFDPTQPEAKAAVERLNTFQSIVLDSSEKLCPSLAMNDGAAFYRDLSPRAESVTAHFIKCAFDIHNKVNSVDKALGFPGARTIVAAGFRVRTPTSMNDELINGYGKRLINQVKNNKISIEQAINNAITLKPFFDSVPELQANFAFSKAFIADEAGSSAGFKGANFYFDHSLFDETLPHWISVENTFDWDFAGLPTKFSSLSSFDEKEANKVRHKGIRNAFTIAESLAVEPGVMERIKALTIKGGRHKYA